MGPEPPWALWPLLMTSWVASENSNASQLIPYSNIISKAHLSTCCPVQKRIRPIQWLLWIVEGSCIGFQELCVLIFHVDQIHEKILSKRRKASERRIRPQKRWERTHMKVRNCVILWGLSRRRVVVKNFLVIIHSLLFFYGLCNQFKGSELAPPSTHHPLAQHIIWQPAQGDQPFWFPSN